MVQSHFRVVYDGPAVADGEMDVSQLASSLLALGKLIENTDAIITGESGRVRVKVQSDVKRGSFDVGIAISFADHAWQAVTAWAMTPTGVGTISILSLLGFNAKDGTKGLIQVVRWLNGRRVAQRTQLQDGNTTIITDDGASLTISDPVARLVDDPTIRQPLERFTEPLREDGVEEIRFEAGGVGPVERIAESEASAFTAAAGAAPTSTSRYPATYQIKRLYFERGKKWRLSNGSQTIMAAIEDDVFWRSVEASDVSFASSDYLVCQVRMDQWLSPAGLKTEFTIEHVDQHIPAPKQVNFDGI
jgi:hypothetical protein